MDVLYIYENILACNISQSCYDIIKNGLIKYYHYREFEKYEYIIDNIIKFESNDFFIDITYSFINKLEIYESKIVLKLLQRANDLSYIYDIVDHDKILIDIMYHCGVLNKKYELNYLLKLLPNVGEKFYSHECNFIINNKMLEENELVRFKEIYSDFIED